MNEDNTTSSVLEHNVPRPAREADITSTRIDAVAVEKAKVAAQELIDQLMQHQTSTATVDGKHNAIRNLRASSLLFENLEKAEPEIPEASTQRQAEAQELMKQLEEPKVEEAKIEGRKTDEITKAEEQFIEKLATCSNKLKELAGEFVNKQVEQTEEQSSTGLAALLRPSEIKRNGLKSVPEQKQENSPEQDANEDYNGWKVIPINTAMGGLLRAAQKKDTKEAKQGSR